MDRSPGVTWQGDLDPPGFLRKVHKKKQRNGGFLKWWYPKMDGLSWKTILKCDDLGVPPFKETPKCWWPASCTEKKTSIYSVFFCTDICTQEQIAIGSMYVIFTYIDHKQSTIHVAKYSIPMNPMGDAFILSWIMQSISFTTWMVIFRLQGSDGMVFRNATTTRQLKAVA